MLGSVAVSFTFIQGGAGSGVRVAVGVSVRVGVGVRNGVRVGVPVGVGKNRVAVGELVGGSVAGITGWNAGLAGPVGETTADLVASPPIVAVTAADSGPGEFAGYWGSNGISVSTPVEPCPVGYGIGYSPARVGRG